MKNIKNQIKNCFIPPKYENKEDFLNNFQYPYSNYFQFLFYQIKFIRKKVWILSIIIFIASIFTIYNINSKFFLQYINFYIPLLAIINMYEFHRVGLFKMYQLEMCSKYNLININLTKLLIISIFNLLLIFILSILFYFKWGINFFHIIFYLFTPFILNICVSLFLFNKFSLKNVVYYSLFFLVIINFIYYQFIKNIENMIYVYILFSLTIIITIFELKKYKNMEGLNAYNTRFN